jgi:DNA repair exonuclease SbcCD ATPase subunit
MVAVSSCIIMDGPSPTTSAASSTVASPSSKEAREMSVDGMTKEQLTTELSQLRKKFVDWKTRAKAGVDVLRAQLTTANTDAEKARSERDAAQEALRNAQHETRDVRHQLSVLQEALETAQADLAAAREMHPRHTPAATLMEPVPADTQAAAGGDAHVKDEPPSTSALESQELSIASLAVVHAEERGACVAAALAAKCIILRSATLDALRVAHAITEEATHQLQQAQKTQLASLTAVTNTTEAQLAAAKAETERIKAEFDKYKSQSSKALKLTSTSGDELIKKVTAAQQNEQRALHTIADLESALTSKDRTIQVVEERYEAAMAQLATAQRRSEDLADELDDLKRAANHSRSFRFATSAGRDGGEACDAVDASAAEAALRAAREEAEMAAEVRLREEMEALAANYRDDIQQKDVELVQLRVRLAQLMAKSGAAHAPSPSGAAGGSSHDDPYTETLRTQLAEARNAADTLRLERDQMQAQIRRLHAQVEVKSRNASAGGGCGAPNGPSANAFNTDANQALSALSPDELRRQLLMKSEQLWDANQQIVQLRATLRTHANQKSSSSPIGGRKGLGFAAASNDEQGQQQAQYTRAVLLNFFTAKSEEVRGGLVPVMATLLQLTTEELKAIYKANPDWIS